MFLDLISSENYKKLNILDQQKIVLTFFYAENFYKLSVPEIIILLQEFERIKSIIDNREKFRIEIEESKEMLFDAAVSISKKNIYFSETLIKDGKQRKQNNDGKTEYKDKKAMIICVFKLKVLRRENVGTRVIWNYM